MKIQFIGCGKMGEIILDSIISNGVNPKDIFIKTKTLEKQNFFKEKYGINIGLDEKVNVLIIVVKPGQFSDLDLNVFSKNVFVISIMAGISIKNIQNKLMSKKIIRVMPNTPMSIGKGVIGYYTNNISNEDKEFFINIFSKTGILIECNNEGDINKITALSGSGPAYFYYFTEILKQKAIDMGFSSDIATLISNNTFIGAASLLEKSGIEVEKLRQNITSPGGTTQKAIETFEKNGFKNNIAEAINEAYLRAKELNK